MGAHRERPSAPPSKLQVADLEPFHPPAQLLHVPIQQGERLTNHEQPKNALVGAYGNKVAVYTRYRRHSSARQQKRSWFESSSAPAAHQNARPWQASKTPKGWNARGTRSSLGYNNNDIPNTRRSAHQLHFTHDTPHPPPENDCPSPNYDVPLAFEYEPGYISIPNDRLQGRKEVFPKRGARKKHMH